MSHVTDLLHAARAEALFVSPLSASGLPGAEEATQAIRTAVRAHGGTRGCAGEVAAVYGDYPDTAVQRMRWALAAVDTLFVRNVHMRAVPITAGSRGG
ncbi:hypothetical protein [Spongiactinospora gelatinilytica]|uniref:hypothetical protein n=1 Tax=Spongiactinospora gelatinilytica TaxID=2666298 RepID=UPI0018F6BD82|nr:hypothetical protein [Spongiactinospora gelatinilytica]